jgi:hypothetical protein
MKITSDAGDETLLTHDPQGVMLTILPENPPVSPDILDVIAIGVSHTSIKKILLPFHNKTSYSLQDGSTTFWLENQKLYITYRFMKAPNWSYTCSYSINSTNQFIHFLNS